MIRKTLFAAAALAFLAAPALAKDDKTAWMDKKPADWTKEDVEHILGDSPWVATTQVFPTALAAPSGKADKPTATGNRVPVQARWFSSGVIRQAIARNAELAGAQMTPEQKAEQTRPDDRFYEILIAADHLDVIDGMPFDQLAKVTTLDVGGETFPLVNLLRPSELHGPQAQFLFKKGKGIPEGAKTAVLKSHWNDADVEFKWDLTKMVWTPECGDGKPTHNIVGDAKAEKPQVRDLDGDYCPIGPAETRRREIASAILAAGDESLDRAISDIRTKKDKDKTSVVVYYDPSKEAVTEGASGPDAMARKTAMTKAVGKWAASHKSDPLGFLLFIDPAKKAPELIVAACAEKAASMDGSAAEKFVKEKLITAVPGASAPNCAGEEKATTSGKETPVATPKKSSKKSK